jgi:hypothetical protein
MARWLLAVNAIFIMLAAGCNATAARRSSVIDTAVEGVSLTVPIPDVSTALPLIPLITYHGGKILRAPELVTVTFESDSSRDFLEQFGDTITSTGWWDVVSEGYCDVSGNCIGHGGGGGHVHASNPPAATYDDTAGTAPSSLKEYIDDNIQSGLFPAPNGSTLYLLYFPNETTITLDGLSSCAQFGGYHNSMTTTPKGASAPVTFSFVVIPRCEDGQNVLTLSASHEIIEAATDPFFDGAQKSYSGWGSTGDAWDYFTGGEVADRCVLFNDAGLPIDTSQEGEFLVQRSFSNTSARAHHDPCVPAASFVETPYFNVAPQTSDVLTLEVGETVKIPMTAFSDGSVPPFTLSVEEMPIDGTNALDLSLNTTSAENGQVVYLSVTLKVSVSQNVAPFKVTSKLGNQAHFWPFLVREASAS